MQRPVLRFVVVLCSLSFVTAGFPVIAQNPTPAYERNPNYKPARTLVHTLVDVVAKGGNYLIGIGPSPDGTWDETAYDRLREIGSWVRVNGEAIYATRPMRRT